MLTFVFPFVIYSNNNEDRAHLASQLRIAVDCVTYAGELTVSTSPLSDDIAERGPAVAALSRRLQSLLISNEQSYRLAAIAAFTSLINTETESIPARAQRAANAVRVLFQTPVTDIATAKAAAVMVGTLANVHSPHSARAVDHVLTNAINLIGSSKGDPKDPLLSTNRARAAMIIAELAGVDKAPKFVFRFQEKLRKALWDVVWDEKVTVREQGVKGLQAILKTIMIRGEEEVQMQAMNDVMCAIRKSLNPDSPVVSDKIPCLAERMGSCKMSVVHGSLLMVASLLSADETSAFVQDMTPELCQLLLRFQKSYNRNVRAVVAEILPLLVQLDSSVFEDSFLPDLHRSTIELIEDRNFPPEERGKSLVSLAATASRTPKDILTLLMEDILAVCRANLVTVSHGTTERIRPKAILRAISHLAKAAKNSHIFEQEMREGMLSLAFKTEFTLELVVAVNDIGKSIPSLAQIIQGRLYSLVAATLRGFMRDKDVGLMRNGHMNGYQLARQSYSQLGRTPSMSVLDDTRHTPHHISEKAQPASLDRALKRAETKFTPTSPRDFFKQYPFSLELHRVDSGAALSTASNSGALDGLVTTFSSTEAASPSIGTDFPILHVDTDYSVDRHNSPCVALKAIIKFDFVGMKAQDYTSFANEFVVGYIESSRVKVRALAVASSLKLMESAARDWEQSWSRHGLSQRLRPDIQSILAQALLISVSDPSNDVRYVALRSLDRAEFYPYILQPESLSTLFMSFYDESLAMRNAAVSLAARLAKLNPGHILPALRRYLVYLLTTLKLDGEHFENDRRNATLLIYTLVHYSKRLVEPYTNALLDALLIRLQEAKQNNDSVSALPVLLTIADLGGTTNRIDMHPYLGALVPLIVSSVLQVQSAEIAFRKAALRALAALVQNTAFVIKPYAEHQALLPGLLEMLRVETDASVRMEVEALIGSLGAADPEKHKYAALPMFMGKQDSSKPTAGESQGRSLFRLENLQGQANIFARSAPNTRRQARNSGTMLSGGFARAQARYDSSSQQAGGSNETVSVLYSPCRIASSDLKAGLPHLASNAEELKGSIALFALGGTRLGMIAGYVPVWDKPEAENSSLVGQLEHPFTSSPQYFPSVALDLLHNILANPRLRVHDREACQAIVNILKSVGDKCAYFLPAVVPRILWLLAQCYRTESSHALVFTQLQEQVMQRLGDIIWVAGSDFMPYAFDTVLLTWYYLKNITSAACVVSVCGVLMRIRKAIGDEFKPVIATILPPLLAALAQDRSQSGSTAKAVLRAIESFSPLLGKHAVTVLICITKVFSRKRPVAVRQEALSALAIVIENMVSAEVIACVIHPLMRVLTGVTNESESEDYSEVTQSSTFKESGFQSREEGMLSVAAARVIVKLGNRQPHGFNVFVPVIAKGLKCSDVKSQDPAVYAVLEEILLRRNPDVVSELLESSPAEIESESMPNVPNQAIDEEFNGGESSEAPEEGVYSADSQSRLPLGSRVLVSRVHVLESSLARKWTVDRNYSGDDWIKWMAEVGAMMFEQSGSPAFRACVRVSESYPPFAVHLFNAAFLSCWTHPLTQGAKELICNTLDKALVSKTIPLNVLQALLNLFEFMDHDEKPLPAPKDRLAWTACKCGAFAKAVRYREQDYAQHCGRADKLIQDMNGEDGLIAIYEKLGHIESAVGTIAHYQNTSGEKVKEKWFEKLRKWDDALVEYERERITVTENISEAIYENKARWENTLGRLRCLNEIGEWHKVIDLLDEARKACRGNRQALCELALNGKGVSVALDLGRWDEFETWVGYLSEDTFQGCFYKTILLVRQGKDMGSPEKLEEAEKMLYQARCKLDLELTARVSEGYPRAYNQIVEAQILVELEEMIRFLRCPPRDVPFARQRLGALWNNRLQGCKKERLTWYRILMVRAIVVPPIEDKNNWLDFTGMCRKSELMPMASESLRILLASSYEKDQSRVGLPNGNCEKIHVNVLNGVDTWDESSIIAMEDLDIKFACAKYLWANRKQPTAYRILEASRNDYLQAAGLVISEVDGSMLRKNVPMEDDRRVLAGEVFSKLSKWGDRLIDKHKISREDIQDPILYAYRSTRIRPDFYKCWHLWATLNASRFEAIVEGRDRSIGPRIGPRVNGTGLTYQPNTGGTHLEHAEKGFLTSAVKGFFRAIDLSANGEDKFKVEDSLKLLTLWFNYGGLNGIYKEFDKGFRDTNIAQWVEVVPQIIARLYTPFPQVQRGVKALLLRIGTEYPHLAVYPLTVAKSNVGSHQQKRSKAAFEILDQLKQHHGEIVEQAEFVSHELVRVAVLWSESWYESLEEASKMYFINHSIEEMLDTLLPLHEELERGAETIFEQNFINEFGAELIEAGKHCRKLNDEKDRVARAKLQQTLNAAWNLYHGVFRRIQKQHLSIPALDLAYVSNGLNKARNLTLAVPGTYVVGQGKAVVGIQSVKSQLTVIQSKQRPRKIGMTGSDGVFYEFLLKGREDLRQDERVMQVYRLINKLFSKSSRRSILQDVGMRTYAVVALSGNAGVIEWVPHCDTLHQLVKEYREVRKVMPNIEHRVMLQAAPEPDRLPLLQKIDLFEFMLSNTGGVDIANVLWLKSRNSEMWLDRRTTYAKSLATTSMAGYLLGLGDRHPSNVMIERKNGRIMHIDFGDCFEVAMKRERYPETVPFRLTRMLIGALEPCGVEGYFRHTAEATMHALRDATARESLMSMMEAFVYDPLIRWKLIGTEELVKIRDQEATGKGRGQPAPKARQPPGEMSELGRSITSHSGLAAFVRAEQRAQNPPGGATEENIPGSIPTPNSTLPQQPQEDFDPANLVTPNEIDRMEQQRLIRSGSGANNSKIADISNRKARVAISRIADKLCGTDYEAPLVLSVEAQVNRLIRDAQDTENLCQLFMGWCAFW